MLIQNGPKYGESGDKNSKIRKNFVLKIIIVLRLKVMQDMVKIIIISRLIFREENENEGKYLQGDVMNVDLTKYFTKIEKNIFIYKF